jgi:hypothetical protein
LLALYLFRHRRLILKSNFFLLLASLGFMGASMTIDIIEKFTWQYEIEDGAKLLGIAFWLAYYLDTCLFCLRGRTAEQR